MSASRLPQTITHQSPEDQLAAAAAEAGHHVPVSLCLALCLLLSRNRPARGYEMLPAPAVSRNLVRPEQNWNCSAAGVALRPPWWPVVACCSSFPAVHRIASPRSLALLLTGCSYPIRFHRRASATPPHHFHHIIDSSSTMNTGCPTSNPALVLSPSSLGFTTPIHPPQAVSPTTHPNPTRHVRTTPVPLHPSSPPRLAPKIHTS
jgi:hypothetical protein